MSERDVRAELRRWIVDTSGASADAITDSTALFAGGLLKSVHVLDLILLIEELAERELDVERLAPSSFKDIDTIYANFLAAEAA